MQQLPLEVRLADHAVFESFHAAGNELLVHQLQAAATLPGQPPLWLWAPPGQGKSHLLQAAVALADETGRRAAYLPLDSSPPLPAGVLEGMGTLALVCLDDLQVVTGQPEWERALFVLYEELRASGGNLIVAGTVPPGESVIALADLASRLKSGTSFRMQALDDEGRLRALQMRARFRGFELPDETGRYLLARVGRGVGELFGLLDELDRAALAAQKQLTIPFVRQVLGS
ncbi:MAG: DnaA regulatory inactivator Hda [Gammaproteobacteria bacterium]|nr:DnaA regulatory inactivator Hda [Gammaproteobacteria bacterium]